MGKPSPLRIYRTQHHSPSSTRTSQPSNTHALSLASHLSRPLSITLRISGETRNICTRHGTQQHTQVTSPAHALSETAAGAFLALVASSTKYTMPRKSMPEWLESDISHVRLVE